MTGRHRTRGRFKATIVAVVAAMVLGLATVVWAYTRSAGRDCAGEVRLAVGAAAEIAPAIRSAAAGWAKNATVDGKCVVLDVVVQEPADVAAAVAREHSVSLLGLGRPNGNVRIPDVWVPDSSLWPVRLRAAAPGFRPVDLASLAASPVVVAVPRPLRDAVSPPGVAVTWDSLLRRLLSGGPFTAGLLDPTRDTASLASLIALADAAAKLGPQAQAALAAGLRLLARGSAKVREGLLNRLPQTLDAETVAASLTAAVVPEQAVIQYNQAAPAIPLAALSVAPQPPALDYPFLVMPDAGEPAARTAKQLRAVLASAGFRNALARQGLRGPDGLGGAGFAYPDGTPTWATTVTPPSRSGVTALLGATDQVLSVWLALIQPGRILAVLDVSGSMAAEVPTAGDRTREQVTVDAAAQGLQLFDDSWAVGLWVFSTNLDRDRDYRELLPISPVSAVRSRATLALRGIQPKKNGDTGLYDTTLAAYRSLLDTWQAGRLNTVVVLTDGDNHDDSGISLPALLDRLRRLKDPKRPVDVVFIGIGPDVSERPLQQIVATTGGGVFVAPDPADIGRIFLKALALHSPPR